mmetsp:Transcript_23478/g.32772  ORF Transcript_23478/g.32772 Transcript_23478/m.32772 type:complete len:188 (+) Transcript_23478:94-657(+)
MKSVLVESSLEIPYNVICKVINKTVQIKGVKGKLVKSFKNLDIIILHEKLNKNRIIVRKYFINKKSSSIVRTVSSHIYNMILGVSKGFRYTMRLVYSHFPININYLKSKRILEITNYYGSKKLDCFFIPSHIELEISDYQKKELKFISKDIEMLGKLTALIKQKCSITKKDSRVFIDGIYTSNKSVN